jgi:hypothetical protein
MASSTKMLSISDGSEPTDVEEAGRVLAQTTTGVLMGIVNCHRSALMHTVALMLILATLSGSMSAQTSLQRDLSLSNT